MTALLVIDHEGQRAVVELDPARRYVIGRSPQADVVVPDPTLSRRHAELGWEDGVWILRDRGSANGLWVDGQRAEGPNRLEEGVVVQLGDSAIRLAPETRTGQKVSFSEGLPPRTAMRLPRTEALRLDRTSTGPSSQPLPAVELEALRRRHAVVEKATLELQAHEPMEHLLPRILSLAVEAVHPERAALLLREADGELSCRAFHASDSRALEISRTVARLVLERQESLLTEDAGADARLGGAQSLISQGVRGAMAVPLWNNREVIGLLYADSRGDGRAFTEEDLRLLTILGNVAAIQIENHHLFEARLRTERIEREARAAAEIQAHLLPSSPREIPGYRVIGHSAPCHEVGGDFWDVIPLLAGRHILVLGDVAGKGMGAAMVMAVAQTALHAAADSESGMQGLVARVNRLLGRSVPTNRFATLFAVELDPGSHHLCCLNAGHTPTPLRVSPGGEIRTLGPGGPPLGPRPDFPYQVDTMTLEPGEFLFACSDGVTEAADAAGLRFGEKRLAGLLGRLRGAGPEVVRDAVLEAVRAHAAGDPPDDDLTLLILQRRP